MESQINDLMKSINDYEEKYKISFRDFEKQAHEIDESLVNWQDYFDWKTLLNKKRILEREVRKIDNRGSVQIEEN